VKPQNFFRLALLFPYAFWVLCLLIMKLVSDLTDLPEPWQAVFMPFALFTLGIFFWFIPYTLLAIGLGIWSGNKPTALLRKAGLLSPILLFVLLLLEGMIIMIPMEDMTQFMESLQYGALLGGMGLVYGYFCVGIVFGIYKLLQGKNLIMQEASPPAAG
jgi:hypothetical protein